MARMNLHAMKFSKVYPLYVQKVERKGRSRTEVDQVICWLTGYTLEQLRDQIEKESDFDTFFVQAPHINPNSSLITGVVCGVRVEEIEDPFMRKLRYMDKLVDELAKGKALEKILRQ
jgi:hypothetical protein